MKFRVWDFSSLCLSLSLSVSVCFLSLSVSVCLSLILFLSVCLSVLLSVSVFVCMFCFVLFCFLNYICASSHQTCLCLCVWRRVCVTPFLHQQLADLWHLREMKRPKNISVRYWSKLKVNCNFYTNSKLSIMIKNITTIKRERQVEHNITRKRKRNSQDRESDHLTLS